MYTAIDTYEHIANRREGREREDKEKKKKKKKKKKRGGRGRRGSGRPPTFSGTMPGPKHQKSHGGTSSATQAQERVPGPVSKQRVVPSANASRSSKVQEGPRRHPLGVVNLVEAVPFPGD
jgi:hypothetical protein